MTTTTIWQATGAQASRPNALAELQYASMLDSDITPSEDDSQEEKDMQLENVQSAIGVSIGRQQTHLASAKTPASEKAAALDETDGGFLFEDWDSRSPVPEPSTPLPATTSSQDRADTRKNSQGRPAVCVAEPAPRLPSPWRAAPRKMHVEDPHHHRTTLRRTLGHHSRRRAMSGGSASEAIKKYMPSFNLPSFSKSPDLLKFSLPNFNIPSLDHALGRHGHRKRGASIHSAFAHRGITQHDGTQAWKTAGDKNTSRYGAYDRPRHASTEPLSQGPFPRLDGPSTANGTPQRPQSFRLRRSNSDGSLLMQRQMSCASSLGDDTRFEHVQEQVNSRLKAIKDSWQDSSFKLPSMPTMSDFGFGSRDDLIKGSRTPNLLLRGPRHDAGAEVIATSDSYRRPDSRGAPKKRFGRTKEPAAAGISPQTHPFFTQALQDVTGDLVILGGYRGSILRSAEPPHRQLWAPVKVGLNIRKVDLELGLNPEDEETEEQRIIPGGMLTHVGPVDIARRLIKRLRASENAQNGRLRVHNYGYDWRLSPHLLSRRLIEYLKMLPCNQPGVPPEKRGATVIAHSLGGLITRHAINQCPELFAGVVYAGVPQTCVNILGPLRNGDDVLLSSRVLTAQVNFTIRTSYALLPLDGKCFINKHTKEEYPVDFFDINTWSEYRLTPCIAPPLPAPNTSLANLRSASGILSAMSQALPNLPGRKSSTASSRNAPSHLATMNSTPSGSNTPQSNATNGDRLGNNGLEGHQSPLRDAADVIRNAAGTNGQGTTGMAPQMSQSQNHRAQEAALGSSNSNPATAVTIPHDRAVEYLTRTLAEVKKFKEELAFNPEHSCSNLYPPVALIYGKSTPTLLAAKVESRESIKRADAYDDLAFGSGDGVVLARAAMVPEGYQVVRGGVVSSDRGHVTLLGDLEAVGRCLVAVTAARTAGVGLGVKEVEGLGIEGVQRDGGQKSG